MSRIFSIISAGPGQPGLLTGRAREAIEQAGEAYAAGRVAGALASLRRDWKLCPAEEAAAFAAESGQERVAILVPGDAGFFGRVEAMRARLEPQGRVVVYPGMSSVQYLCARIGESYDDVHWMDGGDLLAAVSYHRKVCVLLGHTHTPASLCAELCAAGLGKLRVVVGTRLGTGREHIADQPAQLMRAKKFAAPALVLLFQDAPAAPSRPVFDTDLFGMDGAVRQEVRWNAVNLLRVQPGDTVYDVGAGGGAVAAELARRAWRGSVYALEENEEAQLVLARNREALGGWNIRPVHGKILDAMQALPAPAAAFVGTKAGRLLDVLGTLQDKNKAVRVVVAADSLDRLHEAQHALAALRFPEVAVSQLVLSRGRTLGNYTMMLDGETTFLLHAGKSK